ncbi:MAG TPA: S8 family serine peptidase, partial [Symbiobacteriaceae bacterium]|nr:S8 family serine peptidase [Symbiobacteriaceae bacterium]
MKQRRLISILAALVLVLGFVIPAGAQTLEPLVPAPEPMLGEMVNETPAAYFVELNSPPSVEGTSPGTLRKEKDNFRAAAKKAGIAFKERYAFEKLFNGFSIEVGAASLPALSRIAGVKAVWPVVKVERPAVSDSVPDLVTALDMTGASVAQSELGLTGKGIKVAIMDTGVDYDHPDLGGCFGPGCRVATGWDFVGDAYNADPASPGYNPIPAPDEYPDDCNGHGTHVAGI